MNRHTFIVSALSLSLLAAPVLEATVTINPLLLFFVPGNNVQDLTVTNVGNTTAYVQVQPESVSNVGTDKQKTTAFVPGMDVNKFGAIVSPLKLAIPVNTYRKVRVVSLKGAPAQDVIYYINVSTVKPPAVFAPPETPKDDHAPTTVDFSNSVNYQVQAFILPANPKPEVTIKRDGVNITAVNTGNTYASLRNGQLCNESGLNCKPLPAADTYHLLYAGKNNANTWQFTIPAPGIVKFDLVYAEDHVTQVKSN